MLSSSPASAGKRSRLLTVMAPRSTLPQTRPLSDPLTGLASSPFPCRPKRRSNEGPNAFDRGRVGSERRREDGTAALTNHRGGDDARAWSDQGVRPDKNRRAA